MPQHDHVHDTIIDMGHHSPHEDPGDLVNTIDDIGQMNWVMAFLGLIIFILIDFLAHKKKYEGNLFAYLKDYFVELLLSAIATPVLIFLYHSQLELNWMTSFGAGVLNSWILKKVIGFLKTMAETKFGTRE